jgi:chaperonin GroES
MKKKSNSKSSGGLKVKPLGDRVLIKEIKEDVSETKSGIIIPETVNEDRGAKKGKVVAVGDGRYDDGKKIPVNLKAGDIVLFQWGDMLKIDGEEYFMVSESSVLAVINQ